MTSPRIYVASLSDYNAGNLHGEWIDAAQEPEDIFTEINEMLAKSPENTTCQFCGSTDPSTHNAIQMGHGFFPGNAEEWAIHDYEEFGPLKLSEYESIERVSNIALAIEEHGEPAAIFMDIFTKDTFDEEEFRESYQGEWDSAEAFVEDWHENSGWLGLSKEQFEEVSSYIDWERFVPEFDNDGFYFIDSSNYKVHVFSPNY